MSLLEIQHVTVRFGGVTAVNRATLSAGPGLVTGLIGPNGAGKTTLFNVVSGLQRPTRGRVVLGGEDITGAGPHARARRGLARTFQRLEAFGSLSVRENVLVAAEIRQGSGWRSRWGRGRAGRSPGQVAADLIERVGLTPFADRQADTVPTGTARLLELARALALEPAVLLLDEPSSGLSGEETRAFGTLLGELAAEGRAVLIVEHDMELIMRVCDRIHVLDFGQVIAAGTPAEVRADERVRSAYLGQPAGSADPLDDTLDLGEGVDG
jgi:branched-chain amino acid transport system ATP-binding protein